jgi:hypothetical protein
MSVFQRRKIEGDELRQMPPFDGDVPPPYIHVINTFAGLPGVGRISVNSIVRVLDYALGRNTTSKLLSGNAPLVVMTAGPLIEDQLRRVTVPNKDLQTNLMINILKECAHVEGLAAQPQVRLDYARLALNNYDFDQDFRDHIYTVLATKNQIMVPWQLIEQYPG